MEVKAAIASSPCADVIMLAGDVEHAVTLHLLNDADIVLRTTLFDGDAISVREALFLGTPVIASDTGERPADVNLIDVGDEDGLVQKAIEIAETGKPELPIQRTDNSNIAAVIKLYEQVAL